MVAGSKGATDMIYITGDTHIPVDISKLSTKRFPAQKNLCAEDYVIICGDFGGLWDHSSEEQYWLKWLNKKKFTTLFVDGNHENYKMLNEEFPIIQFCGGNAHRINEKLFHLMRGQVFHINNKKIFTMGGASSLDRAVRKEWKNWWTQEMPSPDEYQTAMNNLNAVDWKVDYVVTHCSPNSIERQIRPEYEENELTCFFEKIKEMLEFKRWFFGHYHVDKIVDDRYFCLFETIHEIG